MPILRSDVADVPPIDNLNVGLVNPIPKLPLPEKVWLKPASATSVVLCNVPPSSILPSSPRDTPLSAIDEGKTMGPVKVVVPRPKLAVVAVRLDIVVVAKLVRPVEVNAPVDTMFVPVALPNSKSVIEARVALRKPVRSILRAVVVPVRFIAFRADIFTEVVAPLTFDDRVLDALAPVVYEIELVVAEATAFAIDVVELTLLILDTMFEPEVVILLEFIILVVDALPFTILVMVFTEETKSLAVLDASIAASEALAVGDNTIAPLIVVVPFKVELVAVRLEIVVVAKLASPVEVNVPVAVMFVPVALLKNRVVMYAKAVSISERPVILSAVVVPVKLIAFNVFIFVEVVAPFMTEVKVLDAPPV
jgi:hypothetical protein